MAVPISDVPRMTTIYNYSRREGKRYLLWSSILSFSLHLVTFERDRTLNIEEFVCIGENLFIVVMEI